jgi:RNA polymerase sigma factor (sigma-70 family)
VAGIEAMMATDMTVSSLLTDSEWLRPLAFRLAGPDDADDALQHAWIAHRAHAASVRDTRSWLGTVVANFSRRRRRDEARRRQHEQTHAAARATTAPATDELVARMELQRRVAEAVLALAEPYRSTLLAHCLDGRTTKQIAEQTGEPWATVRSRLARGIEQLRASLRAEHEDWRDRIAYAVFGVPSARLGRAPRAVGVAAGVAAVVLSSAAAVGVWLWVTAPDVVLRQPDSAPVATAPPAGSATASERTAGAPPAVAEPADSAPAPRTVAYSGQLLDPRGEPLAGVGVFAGERRIATTDDAGRFLADLPAGEHAVATDEQHCLLWSARAARRGTEPVPRHAAHPLPRHRRRRRRPTRERRAHRLSPRNAGRLPAFVARPRVERGATTDRRPGRRVRLPRALARGGAVVRAGRRPPGRHVDPLRPRRGRVRFHHARRRAAAEEHRAAAGCRVSRAGRRMLRAAAAPDRSRCGVADVADRGSRAGLRRPAGRGRYCRLRWPHDVVARGMARSRSTPTWATCGRTPWSPSTPSSASRPSPT